MSYVITEPDVVKGAAQDLAGIRASLADAAATVSGPTTGIVAAGQDEVSIAIASLFGNAGRQFQVLNAQAQAFHAEFESLLGAGAAAYVSAEAANVAQIAGGGQVAAAALPAQAEQTFNFLSGILDLEIGPGGILVAIDAPGINLPALNIPLINLSAFDLPKITIPSISIPPFATPPINVSGFNLPQITTPPISVPPITFPAVTIPNFSLPQIQVPAISFPSIQVPGIGLPTISVPRIGFPGIQFPDLNVAVPGNMEPIITLTNGPLSLTTINLDSFNIVASLGLNTPGYITGLTYTSHWPWAIYHPAHRPWGIDHPAHRPRAIYHPAHRSFRLHYSAHHYSAHRFKRLHPAADQRAWVCLAAVDHPAYRPRRLQPAQRLCPQHHHRTPRARRVRIPSGPLAQHTGLRRERLRFRLGGCRQQPGARYLTCWFTPCVTPARHSRVSVVLCAVSR